MKTVNYGGRIVPASTPLWALVRIDERADSKKGSK